MTKTLYEKIYTELKKEILEGKYQVGEKIPSEKELAKLWNVSRITTKKSLEMLVNEELIIRQAGRGSFVADRQDRANGNSQPVPLKYRDKPRLIGFIISDLDDDYGLDILKSIENEAAKNNCFVIVKRSLGESEKEKEVIKELLKIDISGIIILPVHAEHFNEEILKLVVNDFPIVLVDRYLKGVPAVSVSSDNYTAAKKAVEYLFDLGHINVSLLSLPQVDTSALEERYEGFISAHVENDIKIDRSQLMNYLSSMWTDPFNSEKIKKDILKIRTHLEENPQITALLAMEYRIALLAESAIKDMGKSIPEDYSVICFDSNENSVEKDKFTYVKQNQTLMGELAVQSILKLNNDENIEKKTIKLDTTLIEGKSTKRILIGSKHEI